MAVLHIDGLVQERCNSNVLAMELRPSCINPSIWCFIQWKCSFQMKTALPLAEKLGSTSPYICTQSRLNGLYRHCHVIDFLIIREHWKLNPIIIQSGQNKCKGVHFKIHNLNPYLIEAKWRIYASVQIPTLVQIMACRLVGAKPLSEPMLEYC